MGYMVHHAIVITGPKEGINSVYKSIRAICQKHEFVCEATKPTPPSINAYSSILIAPDGSKSGWDKDAQGEKCRDEIVRHLKTLRVREGSFRWVEVQYADDEGDTRVTRDSDHEQLSVEECK